MSRYIRPKVPGASLFFTVALADRSAQTLVDHVELLRKAVRLTKTDRPFRIDAWVVLPDHFHAVWTLPKGDADFSTRMAAIKARFTRDIRRSGFTPTLPCNPYGAHGGRSRDGNAKRVGVNSDLQKNEAPLWQKRFWEHHIRDNKDFAAHVALCWMDPVKHGLVAHPGDWPYSSWHRDGEGHPGLSGGVYHAARSCLSEKFWGSTGTESG